MKWHIKKDISEPEGSCKKELRYCVIHTKGSDIIRRPMIVIGLNPSGRSLKDENGKDVFSRTAVRLHSIADHNKLESIILFNLTPIVDVSSASLPSNPDLPKKNGRNIEEIMKALQDIELERDTPILLCFGHAAKRVLRKKGMDCALRKILNIDKLNGKQVCCLGMTKSQYPIHPLHNGLLDLYHLKIKDETVPPTFIQLGLRDIEQVKDVQD